MLAISAVVFLATITRFGWLSDDSFISFRAVQNLTGGNGLVSDPGQRVQGFTNPLWTLLVAGAYGATHEIYGSAIGLSLGCCVFIALAVGRLHRWRWPAAWALILLASSSSFVTFSTGGLENALGHLLLVGFVASAFGARAESPWLLWSLGFLTALNRLDNALLVLPALAASLLERGWRPTWRPALVGAAPLGGWLIFATIYYGFPFPNTAYAKLNVSIPRGEVLAQGLTYLVDSLVTDPIVVVIIVLAICHALLSRPRSRMALAVAGGIASYILYVCWIGGDFMSGRFLTAPFLLATLLLSRQVDRNAVTALALAAIALFAGQRMFLPLPNDTGTQCPVPPSGIVDERACYVEHTGIAQNVRTRKYEQHSYFKKGIELAEGPNPVVVSSLVGMGGYAAGPGVHIVDPYGLTDPFLARLTFAPGGGWRPGHLERSVPPGYLQSLRQGRNLLEDPCEHQLFDDLRLITAGPFFTGARWRAIGRRNVGQRSCAP